MLERFIVGIVIGFIAGIIFNFRYKNPYNQDKIGCLISLVMIAFIAASFGFGIPFGIMAIVELSIGCWIAARLFKKKGSN